MTLSFNNNQMKRIPKLKDLVPTRRRCFCSLHLGINLNVSSVNSAKTKNKTGRGATEQQDKVIRTEGTKTVLKISRMHPADSFVGGVSEPGSEFLN